MIAKEIIIDLIRCNDRILFLINQIENGDDETYAELRCIDVPDYDFSGMSSREKKLVRLAVATLKEALKESVAILKRYF